jgi:hypothetical protein
MPDEPPEPLAPELPPLPSLPPLPLPPDVDLIPSSVLLQANASKPAREAATTNRERTDMTSSKTKMNG